MRTHPNTLRIIGGEWRGRKLQFPNVEAIRPTPDRVRETVFNWLQHIVVDAECLDLFAGSGALGLEALSRGAKHVTFVDREPQIARYLKDTLTRLGTDRATIVAADALRWFERGDATFDIVFLDPPFGADLLFEVCERLETSGRLKPKATIYLECPASAGVPRLPIGWALAKSKTAGQVGYHLARRNADE